MPPAAAANAAEPDVHLDVNAAAYAVTAVVEMMVVVPTQTQPSLRLLFGARILIELGASSFEISLVEEEPMAGCRRLWWRCPRCERRARHIYLLEGRCRRCLGLEYSSRHTQRWANAHRIARLRRLLGVNEQPFAAIPPPKRRRGRYWRLAAAIVVEERKLLADMRRFAASVGKGSAEMKSTTILDKDRIVEAAVAGESNKRIAQRYGCTLYDVRTALDEFAAEQLRPSSRAAALALEVNRLDKLMSVFLREAIESPDAAAGTLCCKLSQRKAALLGLDQPQVVRMDMSVVVELYQETSTENLRRVLWELRNPGRVYSREAADREDDPPAADEPDPE